jgi:hypothetical protein
MKRPDFNQRDSRKSDYIKNNPFPQLSDDDDGKVLQVENGKYVAKKIPEVDGAEGFVKKLESADGNLIYVELSNNRGIKGYRLSQQVIAYGVPERDANGHIKVVETPTDNAHPVSFGYFKSQKGAGNGIAELGADGKVLTSQLPSYVDDVLQYDSRGHFPKTGESGKIYIAKNTNLTYRWSGSDYVEISPSLALGETAYTAYRGDRGKTAYEHSQTSGNPHSISLSDLGVTTEAWTFTVEGMIDPVIKEVCIIKK